MLQENCPKCKSKSKVQSKKDGIQHRKCLSCDFNFNTVIVLVDKVKDIKQLLADYGHAVNTKIIEQLTVKSNMAEIHDYLANQTRIISHYELENKPVENPTGFIINAILNHYPIPPNWYDVPASQLVSVQPVSVSASQLNGHGPPKNEAADTWATILGRLELTMTQATFDFLLRGSKGVYQSQAMLVVQVKSKEAMEVLEGRLAKTIFEESEGLELRFIV
jgi:Zn ribbon nucleic-acid-binding protein